MSTHIPWTLALAGTSVILYLILGPVPGGLILDRSIPPIAEPWRVVTAHLTHSDAAHLALDVAGLALVGALYEPLLRGRMAFVMAMGAPALIASLILLEPTVTAYCGPSGVVNLIVGAGLVAAWRTRDTNGMLVLFALAVAAKILAEGLSDQAIFSDTDWAPLHAIHAAAFIIGAVLEAARATKISRILKP
jgi:rhomboid family GlyGly-CTERM serine protease